MKDRLLNNFKKNKFLILIVFFLWISITFGTVFYYSNVMGKQSHGNEYLSTVIEINSDTTVKGVIPVVEDSKNIGLKFATYGRNNSGSVTVKVTGQESHKEYISKIFDTSIVQDNAFMIFDFSEDVTDKNLIIEVSSNSEEGKGIGLYYLETEESQMEINSVSENGLLTYRLLTEDVELLEYYKIQLICLVTGISFIILLLLLVEPKYEALFATIALIIGLAFCMIITPMSVPDEQRHYEFAFQMSNYMMFEDNHLLIDEEYQNYGVYGDHINVSATYRKLLQKFNSKLELENKTAVMEFDVDEVYNVDFIVPGVGITVARLLKLNRFKTFYLGRFFNLMFYTLCVYLAVKKTPVHKLIFGILMCMPMFLQQAASYSYDCFVNGLSFVLIAYLLKFYFVEEKINKKEYIVAFFVSLILSPAKAIYSFFSLLFWIIPTERFGSKKNKIIMCLLLCVMPILQLGNIAIPVMKRMLGFFSTGAIESNVLYAESSNNYLMDNHHINPFYITTGDIMRNPGLVISMVIRTVRYNLKNWFYGSLGRTLSGLTLVVPLEIVHIMTLVSLLAGLRKEKYIEPVWMKSLFIIVCVIVGIFTMGGMLLSYTSFEQEIVEDFGGPMIQGIQGRYFCPLLALAYPILNNKYIKIPEKYDKYIIISHLFVLFEVLMYVLSYTFINS